MMIYNFKTCSVNLLLFHQPYYITIFQSLLALGLITAGALGTAVQAVQINDVSKRVDNKALASDVSSALSRISALESAALTTSASVTSMCTSVSPQYLIS